MNLSFKFVKGFSILACLVAALGSLSLGVLLVLVYSTSGPPGGTWPVLAIGLLFLALAAYATRALRHAWQVAEPPPAVRMVLRALRSNRRASEWGFRSADVLGQHFYPELESSFLLAAFAVEVDGGSLPEAKAIIDQALAASPPRRRLYESELWFQGAMFSALVSHDPGMARYRFEAGARVSSKGLLSYPALAQAAVLWAEGDQAGARERLGSWTRAFGTSGRTCAGNHWALERLQVLLVTTHPTATQP